MPHINIRASRNAGYTVTGNGPKVALLLHGYQQRSDIISNLLGSCFDTSYTVYAPDGTFPVPVKKGEGYDAGFSWYFFDPATNFFFVEMDEAIDYLREWISGLGIWDAPKVVVGYSQGGYLAPFVAQQLEGVSRVVGINCRFRSETLPERLNFPIYGIHGERDELVDPVRAEKCHKELIARGNQGEFYALPNCGHGVSGRVRENALETGQPALSPIGSDTQEPGRDPSETGRISRPVYLSFISA